MNFGLVFETLLAAILSYTPGMDKGLRMYPHEEPLYELRPRLRDPPRRHPVLHARHGQGPEDVPPEDQLVAACHPLLHPDLLLRRDEKVLAEAQPRRLDRE